MAKQLTKQQRFWLGHLERARAKRQSIAAYARANGLSASQLYSYRSKLKRGRLPQAGARPSNAAFVQVTQREPEGAAIRVELPNGVALSLTGALDVDRLLTTLVGL